MAATTVTAGHVGIVLSFGQVQPTALTSGFHWKTPFVDTVREVDVRIGSVSYSSIAFSKDLQTINTQASLQYSIDPVLMPEAYKTIGDRQLIETTIIEKAIAESLKAVTSNFTAEELIVKRQAVKVEIRKSLEDYINVSTTKDGLGGLIEIANLAITDFQFSTEFNRSIENKVKAEQEALQAKNEKDKLVTEAEASARQKEIAADARAYEIEKMAKAEAFKQKTISVARAQAIKAEAAALKANQDLIKLRAIERWNGELPKYSVGGNSMPLLNLGDILDDEES